MARRGDAASTSLPDNGLQGNRFGLFEAVVGYIAGFVAAEVGLVVYGAIAHKGHVVGFAADIAGLVGLWVGFFLGALVGLWRADAGHRRERPDSFPTARAEVRAAAGDLASRVTSGLSSCYGLSLRPVDVPLGIAAGLLGQYLVVPIAEAPLLPFVPHLFQRLSGPANSITGGVTGAGLLALSLLICIGTPFFEELYFRGLVLRGLLGALQGARHVSQRQSVVLAALLSAIVFGLAHFELLELPGLIGAGVVFGTLAVITRRLGPGMVAHATFNAVTVISIVHGR